MWLGLVAALVAMPRPVRGLPAQAASGPQTAANWRRAADPNGWRVSLDFTNYNGDRLSASIPIPKADIDQAVGEFGYTKAEVEAVFKSCRNCNQAEFDRRVLEFYRRRGFQVTPANGVLQLSIDMNELVWRNAPRMRVLAREVERIGAERQYDASALLGAVLAMAQTALEYFSPPLQEGGREISGLYVPPQVLTNGKGDCDSKTALVASVLKNFSGVRLLGIAIPNHYLLGVARIPQRGEAFVEYGGEAYVLLEPAGPGWLPPGRISTTSLDRIGTMRDVRIEPFR